VCLCVYVNKCYYVYVIMSVCVIKKGKYSRGLPKGFIFVDFENVGVSECVLLCEYDHVFVRECVCV